MGLHTVFQMLLYFKIYKNALWCRPYCRMFSLFYNRGQEESMRIFLFFLVWLRKYFLCHTLWLFVLMKPSVTPPDDRCLNVQIIHTIEKYAFWQPESSVLRDWEDFRSEWNEQMLQACPPDSVCCNAGGRNVFANVWRAMGNEGLLSSTQHLWIPG